MNGYFTRKHSGRSAYASRGVLLSQVGQGARDNHFFLLLECEARVRPQLAAWIAIMSFQIPSVCGDYNLCARFFVQGCVRFLSVQLVGQLRVSFIIRGKLYLLGYVVNTILVDR